jgi:hypothetical protein
MPSVLKITDNKYKIFSGSKFLHTSTFSTGRSFVEDEDITWIEVSSTGFYPFSQSVYRIPDILILGINFKYCSLFDDHIILGFVTNENINRESYSKIASKIYITFIKFINKWFGMYRFLGKKYMRKHLERLR